MEIALGAYGIAGKVSIDEDALRIFSHGTCEEIRYSEIVSVKPHRFLKKISVRTAGRVRTLFLWSGYPNKHKDAVREILARMDGPS